MSFKMAKVGELKVGSYALINGIPCRIAQVTKSKPGKHGSAKFRCVAISLFDGTKQSFVDSTGATITIPLVDKRSGQVVSMTPANVQLMDLENYDMMDVEMPTDEDIAGALAAGKEVEYWVIMDRIKIQRVKN